MKKDSLPPQVIIREVGPREGFQILPTTYPIEEKLRLIEALVKASISQIEVTSFVRPDRVPQMADAEEYVARLPLTDGVQYSALYLNPQGFERAEKTGKLANMGWLYTSPSAAFLKANNNTSIDESVATVPEWAALFERYGKAVHGLMVSNAFGCAYEGRVSSSAVVSLVERFAAACEAAGESISEVCLADTVGMGNPKSVRECVAALRALGFTVSLHLHDTLGLGLANVYAGLLEGVSIFETSVGGMGGCPFTPGAAGNVATEDVVYLCQQMGVVTNIDLELVCEAAKLAEFIIGTQLPGRVYRTRSSLLGQPSCIKAEIEPASSVRDPADHPLKPGSS